MKGRWTFIGVMLIASIGAGCGSGSRPAPAPSIPPHYELTSSKPVPPAVDFQGPGVSLSTQEFSALSIPPNSRLDLPIPTGIPITGPWKQPQKTNKNGWRWTLPIPFRPRGMFFSRAQPGMEMRTESGKQLPFQPRGRTDALSWAHDLNQLWVITPNKAPPPPLILQYSRATERERALNYDAAVQAELVSNKAEFVRSTQVQEGWESHRGLFLPAPAVASFKVHLPPAAVLTMTPGVSRPEVADLPASDGCTLTVEIAEASDTSVAATFDLQPGAFTVERVDLSAWANRDVTLSLKLDPKSNPRYDYCMIGDPVISAQKKDSRRFVLVFIDTLRPDHLSAYGYERSTSPNLEAFAATAARFTNARSIAPWTLPSARTVVTGQQPELYPVAQTLQSRFREGGWATGMIAGNVYLSANFEMSRDWGYHKVDMYPPPTKVTDDALKWLSDHHGQDALLMVHYMSAHLPYLDEGTDRARFAGEGPVGLQQKLSLKAIRKAERSGKLDDEGVAYLQARYDNNIYRIDRAVGRLLAALDDNDVVVVFSDHGEEFWDHGGFEHGHTLYDELLHVPLLISGLPQGVIDEPVSLLDLAPTVASLAGLDLPHATGLDLRELAAHNPTSVTAFKERIHAFGRPLYGRERWGVLDGGLKWSTTEGREQLYDLSSDPKETLDIAKSKDTVPFYTALGDALNTDSGLAYRFIPTRGASKSHWIDVTVTVPGGIKRAWRGEDPLQRSDVSVSRIDENTVRFRWESGYSGTREVYVLPTIPAAEIKDPVAVLINDGSVPLERSVDVNLTNKPITSRKPLLTQAMSRGVIRMTWAIAPAPRADAVGIDATDSETEDWLEALGYLHNDTPSPTP